MKIGKAKHPLAVLRILLGKTQTEMAQLVGVSTTTVVSIEVVRLALSSKLAARIAFETNVSEQWLLAASVKDQPTDRMGRPYSKDTFDKHRSDMDAMPSGETLSQDAIYHIGMLVAQAASALVAAGPKRYRLCRYKLHAMLGDLSREFGCDRATMNALVLSAQDRKILSASTISTIDKSALSK